MTDSKRRDDLGDEFRGKADLQRQQFLNWTAIASAGGIALIVGFAAQNQSAIYALRPALIAWLFSIVSAGAALFGFYREASYAATSFHRQAERDRESEALAKLSEDDAARATSTERIAFFHHRADVNHVFSRRWMKAAYALLLTATACFTIGAGYAIYLAATNGLTAGRAAVAPQDKPVAPAYSPRSLAALMPSDARLPSPVPSLPALATAPQPSDRHWLVAPLITAFGIVISGLLAVAVPIYTSHRQRRLAAQAAALVAQDALGLIIDRLSIRFNPALLPAEGTTLREYRATAAVNTLMEMKMSELPPTVIPHFSRLRSGLFALNSAMTREGVDDETEKQTADGQPHPSAIRLARYSNVFSWTIGSYEGIRSTRWIGGGLTDFDWRPPPAPSIASVSGVDTSTLPQP